MGHCCNEINGNYKKANNIAPCPWLYQFPYDKLYVRKTIPERVYNKHAVIIAIMLNNWHFQHFTHQGWEMHICFSKLGDDFCGYFLPNIVYKMVAKKVAIVSGPQCVNSLMNRISTNQHRIVHSIQMCLLILSSLGHVSFTKYSFCTDCVYNW